MACYFSTDINNKLYIGDFGASRLCGQTVLSLCWSSYEAVGGPYKFKKESDIQVS